MTPPMVQLVFILVLYLLEIFAVEVSLFLSLHVKFIWPKVLMGVVAINLVEFGSLLF